MFVAVSLFFLYVELQLSMSGLPVCSLILFVDDPTSPVVFLLLSILLVLRLILLELIGFWFDLFWLRLWLLGWTSFLMLVVYFLFCLWGSKFHIRKVVLVSKLLYTLAIWCVWILLFSLLCCYICCSVLESLYLSFTLMSSSCFPLLFNITLIFYFIYSFFR